ncbi:hypothetical protein PCANC_24233 [Puccinia coronata f. sp. avenae]|uniref:Uncharacterized protein n=1 Tax=Puccinia coronata f. sp. avenae TaxID=200324 RepID=A0A2N5SFC8_9BASI|nr:hypothetical protein PCANC_24233 [Puccinia coronata f. sp. avenae]
MSPDQILEQPLFLLGLLDGLVPVWNFDGLLNLMAKQPPRKPSSGSKITAALDGLPSICGHRTLAEILKCQIKEALSFSQSLPQAPTEDYLIPLNEPSYALILAPRCATWWLDQGYEPNHFVVKLKSVSEDLLLSAERDDVRMTLPFLY